MFEAWAPDLSDALAEAARTYDLSDALAEAATAGAAAGVPDYLLALCRLETSLIPNDCWALAWKVLPTGLSFLAACLSRMDYWTAFLFPKQSFMFVNSILPGI